MKILTSRMPSVPADRLSGGDPVRFKKTLMSRMLSVPADGLSRSFACIGETDEPHAVRTRRWTERKRSCVLLKKLTSRMLSVPADGLSGGISEQREH